MVLLTLIAAAYTPYVSRTVPARCLLMVEGRTIFAGVCDYERFDSDGSFTITERRRTPYFAYLIRDVQEGENYGSWNGRRDSNHADAFLGLMRREGACWVSGDRRRMNKICAWK